MRYYKNRKMDIICPMQMKRGKQICLFLQVTVCLQFWINLYKISKLKFMQNAPYRFYFLQRHQTSKLIDQLIGQIDSDDKTQMINEIGDYLYQFKIVDRLSEWTYIQRIYRVLKKAEQVDKMLRQRYTTEQQIEGIKNRFDKSQFQLHKFRIEEGSTKIPQSLVKFFEIYHTNVKKITSFVMLKKIRGLTIQKKIQNWLCGVQWQPKRIIITQEGILQMATQQGVVTDFLKFDLYFSVQAGIQATSYQFGIALYSAHRKVVLKVLNAKHFLQFLFYIIPASEKNKKKIRYGGSCRPRNYNNITFLVDAEDYYRQVALSLDKAKKTVFMCGWWISPELYLIRPLNQNDSKMKQNQNKKSLDTTYRLDMLLKRVAERGVKIYIVVFYSPSVIPNDSDHTKLKLVSLHPNITVQRHPHEFLPKLWSHHQKAVIIDQKIAFMGGLDLCYGRYDSKQHPLSANDAKWYPGIDYNNVRIKDFFQVRNFEKDLQDRTLPRMPWHDVAYKAVGKVVADVANHFIEYWNFTLLQKSITPIVSRSKANLEQTKQIIQVKQQKTDDLIKAILRTAIEKNEQLNKKQKQTVYNHIQNKEEAERLRKKLRTQRRHHKLQLNNGPGEHCLVLSIETLKLLKVDTKENQKMKKQMNDQLQLLRSASEWSIGLENGVTQRSIQNAYLQLIHNAKHFIYIQNQFFISGTGENNNSYVQNQIANSLYQRIKRAIQAKQKFKVMIFMPLLPGMEGQLSQKCPLSLKLTMYWQYNTIYKNQQSLIQRISRLTDRASDYIQFFSLRQHGILKQRPVTEIIYIHTKLIIVDDDVVLCGSANINDRSQEGSRDSELAVIFSNGEKVKKRMNGQYRQVNEKAHKLREKLFREHFHMSIVQAEDPICDKTWNMVTKIAQSNTLIYRDLFGCCPDDTVERLLQVKDFEKKTSLQDYREKSKNIIGHAVQFPYKFLSKQKLYKFDLDMIQDIFT